MKKNNKKIEFPSAYAVLLALTLIIALVTYLIPDVITAKISDVIMSPITGMVGIKDMAISQSLIDAMSNGTIKDALNTLKETNGQYINVWNEGKLSGAIDVAFFILIIGGFLGVVTKTGSLDAGVSSIVNRLKGRELMLIPILMVLFSLGGTSYGMAEESLAFYALITATMLYAGFDPLVAVATVMLGAGCGVLGSTVNPFATGIASSSAGVEINQGVVILMGVALWISSLLISIFFVMSYAKKVKADPTKSLVSKVEFDNARNCYANNNEQTMKLTTKRKFVLGLFAISFIVMILGVIPWEDFNVTFFATYTGKLTGSPLGSWWFPELTGWFFIMAIIIGIVYGLKEREIVDAFVSGASDMVGVAIIIGISRGISFMMTNTGLDLYILSGASNILTGVSGVLFVNIGYVIYIGLSFLIPSTSGLATVSMPIFAPLTAQLGLSPEVMIATFCAGSGIVNLITPTSGVVMGGLSIAKLEYSTWIKFVSKILVAIAISSIIILSIGIMCL